MVIHLAWPQAYPVDITNNRDDHGRNAVSDQLGDRGDAQFVPWQSVDAQRALGIGRVARSADDR